MKALGPRAVREVEPWRRASEREHRLTAERSTQRFRIGALVFAALQTVIRPGDNDAFSWLVVVLLGAVVALVALRLRRHPDLAGLTRVGAMAMAGDCLVVAITLGNNLADVNDPVYVVTVLIVLEGAMRWQLRGGVLTGLGAGVAVSIWTVIAHARNDVDLPPEYVTVRFGVVALVGIFVGHVFRELETHRRRSDALLHIARELIATFGRDGTVRSVNPAARTILGYEPVEMVGRPYASFMPPGEVGPAQDLLDRLVAGVDLGVIERRFVHANGHEVWLELSLQYDPVEDVVYATGRDVSLRRRQQARLEESEQRFKSLFDHNPDGVFSFDDAGRFTSANPAWQAMTGYGAGELQGARFDQLVAEEDLERTLSALRAALGGSAQEYECTIVRQDRHRCRLHVTNMPIVVGGQVVGVFGVAKDVSERHRLESQLRYQVAHDALTGLLNRTSFSAALDAALARPEPVALLFIDLDRFKSVNDSHGHDVGDAVLVAAAERIRTSLRDGDLLARFAGDEFCALLRGATVEAVAAVAARVVAMFELPIVVDGRAHRVSASVGVAFARPGEAGTEVLRRADTAMYEAKAQGRARVAGIPDPDAPIPSPTTAFPA